MDNSLRDYTPKINRRKFWRAQEGFKEGYPGSFTLKKCKYLNVVKCSIVIWLTGSSETRNNRIMQKIDDEDCYIPLLSPCLFNLYAEYIMRNARLDEAQVGIKIVGRNIKNLRNADDTTLMAESEEELKSLLMKVKEESEKSGLKLNTHVQPWTIHVNVWQNQYNVVR